MPSSHQSTAASISNSGLSHHQPPQQYQKQHRLSRSFPTSTGPLADHLYPTGGRFDRHQGPVLSSLGSDLDTGTLSRKTPSPLPRNSSLRPPPQSAPLPLSTTQDNILHTDIATTIPAPQTYPLSLQRPRTSHSRSSSAGLSTEGIRNLNRWSASTISSRASGSNQRVSFSSHARRLSADAVGSLVTSKQLSERHSRNRRRSNSSEASRGLFSSGSKLRSSPSPGPHRAGNLSTVFAPHPLNYISATESTAFTDGQSELLGASHALSSGRIIEQYHFWDAFSGPGRRGSVEPGSQQSPRAMMPSDRNGGSYDMRGHSRHRSQAAKGSTDTTTSSRGRDRGNKPPSQKAMLSRALQKANTAVQLDNAQNFEGARQAYAEACELLHQVLARTSTEEDRRKLEAIRRTYTSRIEELDQMAPVQAQEGKALPARPESLGLRLNPSLHFDNDYDEFEASSGLETAALTRILRDDNRGLPGQAGSSSSISRKQELSEPTKITSGRTPEQYPLQSSFSRSPLRERNSDDNLIFQLPQDDGYLPPPLSPRRPISPSLDGQNSPDGPVRSDFSVSIARQSPKHVRDSSRESNSWLDPIDESGGSATSSAHSRSSSMNVRRKHIRAPSGATEAEFDAALDAAVEAAYDDGYEPMGFSDPEPYNSDDQVVAEALRKVELAKERVRQTEREVFEQSHGRDRTSQVRQQYGEDDLHEDFYDDGSSDEEERILEEMTRGYSIDDFSFNQASRQAAVRHSGSSEFVQPSWQASAMSANPTGGEASLSPADAVPSSNFPRAGSPIAPPPVQSLPELPIKSSFSGTAAGPGQTVRNRRMSGQNPKQLKIETTKLSKFSDPTRQYSVTQANDNGQMVDFEPQDSSVPTNMNGTMGRPYSPLEGISPTQPVPPTPPFSHAPNRDSEDFTGSHSGSPSFRPPLRKNFSSSSLRSMKTRNMSLSNLDDASDMSPGTPLSTGFGLNGRHPAMPTLPTPLAAAFRDKFRSGSAAGLYLFDDTLYSPQSPGSPNPLQVEAPAPLEPCPTDYLLRPFWLMRCLYQTLAHPRGGYLSNKLFVPRDVWKVKGVKIRNVEDKVATCDYLTAALLKLAKVDTCDADAVLEEMQSLENILEQVQAGLTRKLGTDVGVQSSAIIFRDASNSAEIEAAISVPRSASVSGKSSFSWRRLRSKGSAAGLNNSFNAKSNGLDSGKESPGLETLPMTDHPTSRPTKRDLSNTQFTGPNANYMGSLARLFDAAQAIDQIARQVEDPGLRHADKTQVGLELCTRHAAEFFGFFICRFVLSDLSALLDKFIKRGSEWVLA
ncbi:MIT domain-containing protein [Colletotrichum truncatum]|uniref:MIT domain-containing protein n=1 Tax=Colletotrichum truncatum TaxID=5467 RepID=A0ACC3ZDC4_COLTU